MTQICGNVNDLGSVFAAMTDEVKITDENGTIMELEPNGSIPVTLQDQTTPIIIAPFTLLEQSTTLIAAMAIDDYSLTVANPAGISAGKVVTVFDPASIRYSIFGVLGIAGSVVTLDRPCDFAFPDGSYVDVQDDNLNVDGSGTPIRFGVRNNAGATPPPGIELSFDITRIMFQCESTDIPETDMFGDIAGGLTRGIHVRRRDGDVYNLMTAKTNGELALIMYDWNQFDADKNGTNGFAGRLTFSGQNKMGATVRIGIDEDLEVFIQDDLTSLGSFKMMAEGSVVQS